MWRENLVMLTLLFVAAIEIDEEQAVQVWITWCLGEIDILTAALAWWLVATSQHN